MRWTRGSLIFIVATCVLCLARSTICDEARPDAKKIISGSANKTQNTASVVKGAIDESKKKNNSTVVVEQRTGKNVTSQIVAESVDKKSEFQIVYSAIQEHQINAGALMRGFWVLLGLSVIGLAYMVFRIFGLNKQRPQMVRKYGVLAHKQDIEMRPLPLDEDEDDDTTVFDVSGLTQSRQQIQNLT